MPPATITHLLYLHGFRSSPKSAKARQVTTWMAAHRPEVVCWCPQLPPSPGGAIAMLQDGMATWPHDATGVIGSSLGGFYATVLAERFGLRAVLLNPAVDPARDLADHLGETTSFHGDDPFHFQAEFIGELRAMTPAAITQPDRYFPVIAMGDEVLDAREMLARYAACTGLTLPSGDHAITDFDRHLPAVLHFLGVATSGR
jgi:predicted esterase YcpF (UPF0227 family)